MTELPQVGDLIWIAKSESHLGVVMRVITDFESPNRWPEFVVECFGESQPRTVGFSEIRSYWRSAGSGHDAARRLMDSQKAG